MFSQNCVIIFLVVNLYFNSEKCKAINYVVLDSQAPTLSITSNTPANNNNLRQTISWNTTEPANYECKLNGFVVSCGELGTEGSYTTPNLEDKVHTFEVTAIDDVENRGKPTFVTWRTGTRSLSRFHVKFLLVYIVLPVYMPRQC